MFVMEVMMGCGCALEEITFRGQLLSLSLINIHEESELSVTAFMTVIMLWLVVCTFK